MSAVTTLCWCWQITRKDGVRFGFTDHDQSLEFDGQSFDPESGFDATALASKADLAPDNSDVMGAISSDKIRFDDIHAGRFGDAEVKIWRVNWQDVSEREAKFSGMIGEITYSQNQFTAELRGLADRLSVDRSRHFVKTCTAQLGDQACGVDLAQANFTIQTNVQRAPDRQTLYIDVVEGLDDGWFSLGHLEVLSGDNQGVKARIATDRIEFGERCLMLADPLPFDLAGGVQLRLTLGCQKTLRDCQARFDNVINFQGFPFIPGDDWMMAYPKPTT